MNFNNRLQALPQELLDDIFQFMLIADEPKRMFKVAGSEASVGFGQVPPYERPVPRPNSTLPCLAAYMSELLYLNRSDGVNFARAALSVARLFEVFVLYEHIPPQFCLQSTSLLMDSVLGRSAVKRLQILGDECRKVQRDGHYVGGILSQNNRKLCCEDVPTFFLQASWQESPPLRDPVTDGWVIRMNDGKLRALIIHEGIRSKVTYTWLVRKDGKFVLTEKMAKISKNKDPIRGGVMEWDLEDGHFALRFKFTNGRHIDHYLRSFGASGIANEIPRG